MKVYQLVNSYGGLPAGTELYGPYPLLGSSLPAYFTKENIPELGQYGSNGFFQSAVENNPSIFKLLPEETKDQ